jgi:hypothetical protein
MIQEIRNGCEMALYKKADEFEGHLYDSSSALDFARYSSLPHCFFPNSFKLWAFIMPSGVSKPPGCSEEGDSSQNYAIVAYFSWLAKVIVDKERVCAWETHSLSRPWRAANTGSNRGC